MAKRRKILNLHGQVYNDANSLTRANLPILREKLFILIGDYKAEHINLQGRKAENCKKRCRILESCMKRAYKLLDVIESSFEGVAPDSITQSGGPTGLSKHRRRPGPVAHDLISGR
jgi:hypothetical protein